MIFANKATRVWMLSFWRIFALRYLLTPFGTIHRTFHIDGYQVSYSDYYVFGIRIVRLHQP